MTKSLIYNPVIELDRLVAWSLQNLRGKDISAVICRLVYGSSFVKSGVKEMREFWGAKS